MPTSLPQTTSVFSSSSTSRARMMVPSDTQPKRTAVDHSSRGGGVSSMGARRNAGQYKETFGQDESTSAQAVGWGKTNVGRLGQPFSYEYSGMRTRWWGQINVGWLGQPLLPHENTAQTNVRWLAQPLLHEDAVVGPDKCWMAGATDFARGL